MLKRLQRRNFLKTLGVAVPALSFSSFCFAYEENIASQIINKNGFSDITTAVLFDLENNQITESHNQDLRLPLASVTKALTAVYGLETIGKTYKFYTDLYIDGVITDGLLDGNIYLVGGGDPSLTTDDLLKFVDVLKSIGIENISGNFYYDDSSLPEFTSIDNTQLPEESFNPGLSGLNLNHNKILFKWRKNRGDYDLELEARGLRSNAQAQNISIVGVSKSNSVYDYDIDEKRRIESWRVSKKILGKSGVRWLPVRLSSSYASEVFKSLCLQNKISIPAPNQARKSYNELNLLLRHESVTLFELVKKMLDTSNNLTAEIVGLYAANFWGVQTESIMRSGEVMTDWFDYITKTKGSTFANHSGLTTESRVSSSDFIKFLYRNETRNILPSILKSRPVYGSAAKKIYDSQIAVLAKTGTMHFNRGLSGYITKKGVPKAAFAIFSADIEKKMAIRSHQLSNPPGSKNWLYRAKFQENAILSNWAERYI